MVRSGEGFVNLWVQSVCDKGADLQTPNVTDDHYFANRNECVIRNAFKKSSRVVKAACFESCEVYSRGFESRHWNH